MFHLLQNHRSCRVDVYQCRTCICVAFTFCVTLVSMASPQIHSVNVYIFFQVVQREAKYEGLQDNSVTVSLVNWSLPYAQRYIFALHHEKYTQTKKTVYSQVKRLQVFVVEKLCYKNVIPQYDIFSKKEYKCSSLLQVCLLSPSFLAVIYPVYMGITGL